MALKWLEDLLTPKVEVKVVEKIIVEKPESCPKDSVCAFEYRGKLYRSKDEIGKVKAAEARQDQERRMGQLASELTEAFERRINAHRCNREPILTYTRRDAIKYMLENYDELGGMIRKAKGIPKIEKISDSEYRVVDE